MECPHCLKNIHVGTRVPFDYGSWPDRTHFFYVGSDSDYYWWLEKVSCPACGRHILTLVHSDEVTISQQGAYRNTPRGDTERSILIWPKSTGTTARPD